jgi:hypothetical protein
MESGAGEDLSWFWRGWFYNNLKFDIELTRARYVDNDPKKGIKVTVANKDLMAFPFTIEVKLKDGTKYRMNLPVETWLQNKSITFIIPTTQPAASVMVDPDAALPDADRGNNGIYMR